VRKVKKAGSVRRKGSKAGKNSKDSKNPKNAPKGARKGTPTRRRDAASRVSKKATPKRRLGKGAAAKKQSALPVFLVQELDPRSKCGPGTSVQRLFRLREETATGAVLSHMVFFDRHGWYCEHGRSCPAVPHAMKFGVRARQHGPTHNGRMRV
jgi:hypothetical protein